MAIWILRPGEGDQDLESLREGSRLYLPTLQGDVNLHDLDDLEVMQSTLKTLNPSYDEQALAADVRTGVGLAEFQAV